MTRVVVLLVLLIVARHANAAAPIKEYATWNPADKNSGITLTNSNRTAQAVSDGGVRATMGRSSGKYYWEITVDILGGTFPSPSVTKAGASYQCGDANSWGYVSDGRKCTAGGSTSYGGSYTTGNVIGVALDLDAGKVWWAVNGVWQASGDPASGSNAAYTGLTGEIFPSWYGAGLSAKVTANFGATGFVYTVPDGFKPGVYNASCADEGAVLSEDETECVVPEPPNGNGFAVAGMGAELAGLSLVIVLVVFTFVGVLSGYAFILGFQAW